VPIYANVYNGIDPIQIRVFPTDKEEIAGISEEIGNLNEIERSQTAVLAEIDHCFNQFMKPLQCVGFHLQYNCGEMILYLQK